MKNRLLLRIILFALLSILLGCAYNWIHQQIPFITHFLLESDKSTNWWTKLIHEVYPRLATEKWRFNETFFLLKAEQLAFRWFLFIQIIFILIAGYPFLKNRIINFFERLVEVEIKQEHLSRITLLLYGGLLIVVYDAIFIFKELSCFSSLYTPVGIGKILLPIFPSTYVLYCLYFILVGAILGIVFFPYKWIWAIIASIGFVYYQLIVFGFGKLDHGYVTYTYALLVYPFILFEQQKCGGKSVAAWGIVLIQLLIGLSYFYCGVEKLLISGTHWFLSDNLQQHLLLHETPWGIKLAAYPNVCKFLSLSVITMQCGFILLPFIKKLSWILLPAGFLFHIATWILLDAGGLFNPWWMVYLFFLFPLHAREKE